MFRIFLQLDTITPLGLAKIVHIGQRCSNSMTAELLIQLKSLKLPKYVVQDSNPVVY